VPGNVVQVAAGRDAYAAHLRRERVTQVIAVEVERGNDIKVLRASQHLLKGNISDGILDDEALGRPAPRAAVQLHRAELTPGQLIGPVTECAFRVFHNVALVDNREALALMPHGVFERGAHQALGARPAHGLDPNAHGCHRLVAKSNFLKCRGHFPLEELQQSQRFGAARLVINAGIDVFRVFAEDDHVHLLRVFHRRGDSREILHRAQAHIQVEHLAQRDVEGADAATDGGRERAFDADQVFLEGRDRVIGQPGIKLVPGSFAGIHLEPGNPALAVVGLPDRRVKHALAGGPNIGARAVAADERQYRVGRHVQFAVDDGNLFAGWRDNILVRHSG